jgi:phosphoglycolate phosphatase
MNAKYKAVIFDLDGTLLDTLEDLGNSMNTVLESMGLPGYSIPEYKYFIGRGLKNLAISVLPEHLRDDATIGLCLQRMLEEYGRHLDDRTRPYKGIDELLDSLAGLGIKMAILTNKDQKYTMIVVNRFLSKWKFEAVFGDRPGVPRKPDPSSAFEIAGMMGISPGQIIYLGDTGSDMEMAVNAGMYPVGALWGFREEDELLEYGAKLLIKSPMELLEIL